LPCVPDGQSSIAIGEQLPLGSTVTTLEAYERKIAAGKIRVRVYEVIGARCHDELHATKNWWLHCKGRRYDWFAYPRLLFKAVVMDFTESRIPILRAIGETVAGFEWRGWCTQDVAESYQIDPPALDIYQTANPTPLTQQQVAGEAPMKPGKRVTLRDVTAEMMAK